jgi:transposase
MKKLGLTRGKNQADGNVPEAGTKVFIAVDISRTKWVYAVRWEGAERRRLSTPGSLEHLQALVRQYSPQCRVHVAYEACGFGYEIAWWVEEETEAKVTVVAPSQVERAPGRQVKTDRTDARRMALKLEKGDLKGVHIPTRAQHQRRQLVRTYGQLLQDRKRVQIRVRSILQEHGRIGPAPSQGWRAYEQWLGGQDLPEPVAHCVRLLLSSRDFLREQVAEVKNRLMALAKSADYKPVVDALSKQGGVGKFSAICLVLEIGDIHRFRTSGSFPRYLGLTPGEHSSGEVERRGHILKCGPARLRAALLQCGWAGQKHDPELKEVFARLAPRVGRKRAIVAVTRRLALRIRARWLEALGEPSPQAA